MNARTVFFAIVELRNPAQQSQKLAAVADPQGESVFALAEGVELGEHRGVVLDHGCPSD